jgi:hypothetical protein
MSYKIIKALFVFQKYCLSNWAICLCHLWLVYTETRKYFYFRYEGLSDKFLSCPVQKILLLAGTDRLDRFVTSVQSEKFFFFSSITIVLWAYAKTIINWLAAIPVIDYYYFHCISVTPTCGTLFVLVSPGNNDFRSFGCLN